MRAHNCWEFDLFAQALSISHSAAPPVCCVCVCADYRAASSRSRRRRASRLRARRALYDARRTVRGSPCADARQLFKTRSITGGPMTMMLMQPTAGKRTKLHRHRVIGTHRRRSVRMPLRRRMGRTFVRSGQAGVEIVRPGAKRREKLRRIQSLALHKFIFHQNAPTTIRPETHPPTHSARLVPGVPKRNGAHTARIHRGCIYARE